MMKQLMKFHRIDSHNQTTNTSKNTPQFANIESTNDKKRTREKMTFLEILNYLFKLPWCQSTTGFIAVFYPNFNVTPCDKKYNFFHIFYSKILSNINLIHPLEIKMNPMFILLFQPSELSVAEECHHNIYKKVQERNTKEYNLKHTANFSSFSNFENFHRSIESSILPVYHRV